MHLLLLFRGPATTILVCEQILHANTDPNNGTSANCSPLFQSMSSHAISRLWFTSSPQFLTYFWQLPTQEALLIYHLADEYRDYQQRAHGLQNFGKNFLSFMISVSYSNILGIAFVSLQCEWLYFGNFFLSLSLKVYLIWLNYSLKVHTDIQILKIYCRLIILINPYQNQLEFYYFNCFFNLGNSYL